MGQAFLIALGRPPDLEEHAVAIEALARFRTADTPIDTERAHRALSALCHTLFNSASFLYID